MEALRVDLPKRSAVMDEGTLALVRCSPDGDWVKAVADSARVSVLASRRRSSDEALVRSLIRRKHVSTLSHVTMTWFVRCPIFVARQWMRHWSWDFNEASGRYSVLPENFFVPAAGDVGFQTKREHQGRDTAAVDERLREDVRQLITSTSETAFAAYYKMIEAGISRELARIVLPVNTFTEFYATVTLRDWLFFLQQRLDPHAQLEIRRLAAGMAGIVENWVDGQFMGLAREEMGLQW